jgi:hypothetical protein
MLIALLAILRAAWTAIARSTSDSDWTVAVTLASSVVAFVIFAMIAPIPHTSWVDLGGTHPRTSRHPAGKDRSRRAGRGAEPDLLTRQLL